MTPGLPTSGNPVSSVFAWTPSAAAAGTTTVINFIAQDVAGTQTATSVTIQVGQGTTNPCPQTPPVANPDMFTACTSPLLITRAQLLANDTDPLSRPLKIASVSAPSSGTLTPTPSGYSFTPAPGFSGNVTFTYLLQLDGPAFANPGNSHYYEYVDARGICWDAAKTAAAARTYNGLQGYLATITSAQENTFLTGLDQGNFWLGGSDAAVEGQWRWVTGPETGQLFYQGNASGTTITYSNWAGGEPNDFQPTGEDYAHIFGMSGTWNDLDRCSNVNFPLEGYLVEYGGLEPCTPALFATGTVTISVPAAPVLPVANADVFSTPVSTALTITPAQLLANDTDPLSRPLQVSAVSAASGQATLTSNANGTYTLTPFPTVPGPVTFTYTVLPAGPVIASPVTGHYYEFVADRGICWSAAKTAAAGKTYNGLQGYLVTITSAAESAFLTGRASGNYWIGASDAAVEGQWRWVTGPEAGQLFYQGGPMGTTVTYSNWDNGEPNDYQPTGEDYGHLFGTSGRWNDLDQCSNINYPLAGYIVEYGGLEPCTPVLYRTATVTVNVGGTSRPQAGALGSGTVLEAAPNPSEGKFSLRVVADAAGPVQLDLFDLKGRHLRDLFAGTLQAGEQRAIGVDASALASGLYMVRLQSGQHVQNVRVVIQK